MKKVCALALSILTTIGATAADSAWAAQTSVHLYNWYDFIAPETPKAFQKETGTRVVLDTFDSAETAQGKLMVGRSGYDVVVITSNILPGLIKAGVLQELDRDRLPHWKNLDADILGKLQANDPGNRYAVPYLWGTTGIAYDVDKVRKLLGPDAPVDSWDLVSRRRTSPASASAAWPRWTPPPSWCPSPSTTWACRTTARIPRTTRKPRNCC